MKVNSVLLLRVSSTVDKEVDHPQFFDPPYPLKFLQAKLGQYLELKVHLLDCWVRPMSVPALLKHTDGIRPDLVVVSTSSFDVDVADEYVAALKARKDAPWVVGIGQGFYVNGHRAKEFPVRYDAILLGEPEEEFFRLFDRISLNGSAAADWRTHYRECHAQGRRFVVEDPDSLPCPSYTPEELAAYRSIYPVQLPRRAVWGFLTATRGCPHECVYCSEIMRVSTGKRLRSRSAVKVADEMESLARQGVTVCSFQDDSFSANPKSVRELCTELVARKSTMPWMARIRVDEVSYELLALMKKAGCVMLGIGVEAASERILRDIQKQKKPQPWLQLCRQVFRWTRELGIGTNAYYVIGNPTETREEMEQTIRLALELDSDSIQVHFYTPYPGSAAWEKHKDRLAGCDPTKMFHYSKPDWSLAEPTPDELVRIRSRFYRRYLFRPGFAFRHLRRYGAFYWHNPDIFRSLLGIRKIL